MTGGSEHVLDLFMAPKVKEVWVNTYCYVNGSFESLWCNSFRCEAEANSNRDKAVYDGVLCITNKFEIPEE